MQHYLERVMAMEDTERNIPFKQEVASVVEEFYRFSASYDEESFELGKKSKPDKQLLPIPLFHLGDAIA